ncbi:vegetative cell wall protein gp1-like [Triticum urartu]|uniref:vegetative cell wall protein gp1-like n=1 Tax=Triticum urartu TaxID=4572 RepID=UPI002044BE80|nr:vegetative cell wall protein gp1-like [Triticum urartu]
MDGLEFFPNASRLNHLASPPAVSSPETHQQPSTSRALPSLHQPAPPLIPLSTSSSHERLGAQQPEHQPATEAPSPTTRTDLFCSPSSFSFPSPPLSQLPLRLYTRYEQESTRLHGWPRVLPQRQPSQPPRVTTGSFLTGDPPAGHQHCAPPSPASCVQARGRRLASSPESLARAKLLSPSFPAPLAPPLAKSSCPRVPLSPTTFDPEDPGRSCLRWPVPARASPASCSRLPHLRPEFLLRCPPPELLLARAWRTPSCRRSSPTLCIAWIRLGPCFPAAGAAKSLHRRCFTCHCLSSSETSSSDSLVPSVDCLLCIEPGRPNDRAPPARPSAASTSPSPWVAGSTSLSANGPKPMACRCR